MNIFRFKLGEPVRVVGGHHAGELGTIKAMELRQNASGEIKIVTVKCRERTICTPEHNVRPQ